MVGKVGRVLDPVLGEDRDPRRAGRQVVGLQPLGARRARRGAEHRREALCVVQHGAAPGVAGMRRGRREQRGNDQGSANAGGGMFRHGRFVVASGEAMLSTRAVDAFALRQAAPCVEQACAVRAHAEAGSLASSAAARCCVMSRISPCDGAAFHSEKQPNSATPSGRGIQWTREDGGDAIEGAREQAHVAVGFSSKTAAAQATGSMNGCGAVGLPALRATLFTGACVLPFSARPDPR